MKRHIDEYLTPKIRTRILELVGLNLDENSVMSLMSNELFAFEEYMLDETIRFTKYLIWLKDKNKNTDRAFEKYKEKTGQNISKFENTNKSTISREEQENYEMKMNQRRKEQARIDALSASVNHNKLKDIDKLESEIEAEITHKNEFTETVDKLFGELSDEELEATFSSLIENKNESKMFNETISSFLAELEMPVEEDAYGADETLAFEDKLNIFAKTPDLNDVEFNETINNVDLGEESFKEINLNEETKIKEISFENIIKQATIVEQQELDTEESISFEDNNTQTIEESMFAENEFDDISAVNLDEITKTLGLDNREKITFADVFSNDHEDKTVKVNEDISSNKNEETFSSTIDAFNFLDKMESKYDDILKEETIIDNDDDDDEEK
ncbi:hypothetical protein ESOMN_v1c03570 [Williamsoniiplasma somnilux]|uniref:Uncharacterized protein n=1 Tax=Williamsoniiplasma somnilux TaxID=215578 RepID=A0A2K8NY39_9MOLU|nr:hypothetical protein [Williamsoniiplasma somnilux]ATZ18739.1 hypothetical protein ESOMN_v1c03570 [Williamsoniiplasma somnilux]